MIQVPRGSLAGCVKMGGSRGGGGGGDVRVADVCLCVRVFVFSCCFFFRGDPQLLFYY